MPKSNAREQMIQSAMFLMGENGAEATSFSQVLEHSRAPRGSIYYHFPGGKAEMVEEAARFGGELLVARMTETLEEDDPLATLNAVAAFWRAALRHTNFAAGCPIVAVTVDGNSMPTGRETATEIFQRWAGLHADKLRRHGVPKGRAQSLGTLLVASIEGAVILARAQRSISPFERIVTELRRHIGDAVAEAQAAQ